QATGYSGPERCICENCQLDPGCFYADSLGNRFIVVDGRHVQHPPTGKDQTLQNEKEKTQTDHEPEVRALRCSRKQHVAEQCAPPMRQIPRCSRPYFESTSKSGCDQGQRDTLYT